MLWLCRQKELMPCLEGSKIAHYPCLSFFVPLQLPWLPSSTKGMSLSWQQVTVHYISILESSWGCVADSTGHKQQPVWLVADWLVADLMYNFVRTISSGPSWGTSLVSRERWWGGHNILFVSMEDVAMALLSALSQGLLLLCRVVLLSLVFCKGLVIEMSMSLEGLSKEIHSESCNEGVSLHV